MSNIIAELSLPTTRHKAWCAWWALNVFVHDGALAAWAYRLVGQVVKASASRAEDPGFESRLRRDFFGVESYQWLKNWHSSGYPAKAPGVIGSALGLVGLVSVYCDWVRWKVWSATSISVWQHVKLSEQIRPWDTLPCCWDVKQPTNNNHHLSLCVGDSSQSGEEIAKISDCAFECHHYYYHYYHYKIFRNCRFHAAGVKM